MTFTEQFEELYEKVRIDIVRKVQEIGLISDVGFLTINVKEEEFQFNMDDTYLLEVGEDYLFDKYGHSHSFESLYFEDLCKLVDYLNTLK